MAALNCLLVTYNCGREHIKPDVFAQHLSQATAKVTSPELLVISLQEVAPIAYSFLGGSFLTSYLDCVRRTVDLLAKSWGKHHYISLVTRNVGMTAIMLCVRDDHAGAVTRLETGGTGVGMHEMGNKGAVAIRLGWDAGEDLASLTFVAAHLAPMEENCDRRNEDWENIVRGLVFTPIRQKALVAARTTRGTEEEPLLPGSEDNNTPPTSGIYERGTYLFVAGDLNYRTSALKPTLEDIKDFPKPTDDSSSLSHYSRLLKDDQLMAELREGKTLQGMVEAPITFAPTYKYSQKTMDALHMREEKVAENDFSDVSQAAFGWAPHRWPSWCDRILWFDTGASSQSSAEGSTIDAQLYTSLPLMSTSDHRPVILSLSLSLSSLSTTPIASAVADYRLNPPYPINPNWREKRAVARRRELMVGTLAYLGLTWEGNGILLATVIGALGGWAVIHSMVY